MTLAQCQAAYSITGALSSLPPETSTASVSAATSASAAVTTSTTTTSSSSSTTTSTVSTISVAQNGTVTIGGPTTTASNTVVTAAANIQVMDGGLPVFAAAGIAVLAWAHVGWANLDGSHMAVGDETPLGHGPTRRTRGGGGGAGRKGANSCLGYHSCDGLGDTCCPLLT